MPNRISRLRQANAGTDDKGSGSQEGAGRTCAESSSPLNRIRIAVSKSLNMLDCPLYSENTAEKCKKINKNNNEYSPSFVLRLQYYDCRVLKALSRR